MEKSAHEIGVKREVFVLADWVAGKADTIGWSGWEVLVGQNRKVPGVVLEGPFQCLLFIDLDKKSPSLRRA